MASTYTDGLGIELIGSGDRAGSWGDVTNNNLTALNQSVRGFSTINLGSGASTTINIQDGMTASETSGDARARSSVIKFTGADQNHTVTIQVGGVNATKTSFIAINSLASTHTLTISAGGTSATIPNGYAAHIHIDGGNVKNSFASLSVEKIALKNNEIITNEVNDEVVIAADTVSVGASDQAGVLQSNGNQDLTLKTGNATTGSITITDGANGNIAITPNGSGEVDISKVDIDGGTIDGVTIGGAAQGAGTFSALTTSGADINGGNIDGTTIGGSTPAAGTFTAGTFNTSLTTSNADINGGNVDGTVIGNTTPAAGTFTTGTFNTSITTPSATITSADINGGTIDSAAINSTTIGASTPSSGVFTTGTFNTSLTTSNADINGGNIDGTTVGGATPAAGTFTTGTFNTLITSNADINGGNIDGTTIGGSIARAGTFTTATATTASVSGTATIGTVDATSASVSGTATIATADINGGDIDGVTIDSSVIGGSTPAAGTFTTATATTASVSGTATIGTANITNGTITTADINGGNIDNTVIGSGTAAAGTFAALASSTITSGAFSLGNGSAGSLNCSGNITTDGSISASTSSSLNGLSLNDTSITNVGSISADVLKSDAAGTGLDVQFDGNTGTNSISLSNTLANALDIKQGANSFIKFNTANDRIEIGQDINTSGIAADWQLKADDADALRFLGTSSNPVFELDTTDSPGQPRIISHVRHDLEGTLRSSAGNLIVGARLDGGVGGFSIRNSADTHDVNFGVLGAGDTLFVGAKSATANGAIVLQTKSVENSNSDAKNDFKVSYNDDGTTYRIWHEGNDGAGSGLDADTLDGTQLTGILGMVVTALSVGTSGTQGDADGQVQQTANGKIKFTDGTNKLLVQWGWSESFTSTGTQATQNITFSEAYSAAPFVMVVPRLTASNAINLAPSNFLYGATPVNGSSTWTSSTTQLSLHCKASSGTDTFQFRSSAWIAIGTPAS